MYNIRVKEGKNEKLKKEGEMRISILISIYTVHFVFLKMYYNVFISLFKQRLTDNYFQNTKPDYKHTAELVFSICFDLSNVMII